MSTLIRVNVTNNSSSPKNFYFFQQPAIYSGGSQVYTNSILSTTILPSQQGGSVYMFVVGPAEAKLQNATVDVYHNGGFC